MLLDSLAKLAVVISLTLAVSSCTLQEQRKVPGDRNYPLANRSATHYFLLSGDVDPAIKLKMSARWEAKNPDCSVNTNWLEGVRGSFYTDIPLKMTWTGTHYAALVYLDYVVPGKCDWSFRSVVVFGIDDRGQMLEMGDWQRPAPDEKSFSDPEIWADLVILTKKPLPEKDRIGIRNLICTPTFGDRYHPHVLQCGAKLVRPGWAFGSSLWITPFTGHAQVNFRYE
jgi:hypothetical protein